MRIWRSQFDSLYDLEGANWGLAFDQNEYDEGTQWYIAHENEHQMSPLAQMPGYISSEGVGTGWYYTVAAGMELDELPRKGMRTDLDEDNTEYYPSDEVIPGVFNGHFEMSYQPLLGRFPVFGDTGFEVPGWSFQGGNGLQDQGLNLESNLARGMADLRDRAGTCRISKPACAALPI